MLTRGVGFNAKATWEAWEDLELRASPTRVLSFPRKEGKKDGAEVEGNIFFTIWLP